MVAALIVSLMAVSRGVAAAVPEEQPGVSPVLEITVHSYASISPIDLCRAQTVVTRVYRKAGVNLVWTDSNLPPGGRTPTGPAFPVSVSILLHAMPEYVAVSEDSMGMAPRGDFGAERLAYVFHDRLDEFSRFFKADIGLLLGHVIAHEIGHLLLPYPSHSATGLMKARWVSKDFQDLARGAFLFTPEQGAAMRATLARFAR